MSNPIRMPPVQSLVVFEAAARKLSFTAAAEELHSTQPAVSQQIRSLEHFLETPLFTRIYRGVELTESGELLYQAVQDGLSRIRAAVGELQKRRATPHINVATDFAFAAYWLMPRLPAFRQDYPDVDIRIQTSQSSFGLPEGEVDVSIVFGDQKKQDKGEAFKWSRLFQERVFPVCSPGLLKQTGQVKSLKKLAGLPLLKLYADANQSWLDWNGFFQQRHSVVQPSEPVMEFNNYTLLIQAAIAGQGVGLGWGHLVDDMLDKGFLTALTDFSVVTDQGYFVVQKREPDKSEEVNAFIDWLTRQAEQPV